jgi:putative NIF3 family GTP cyclohydrolase 1 type 2
MATRMAACNQIIGYLDELLDPTVYDDYGPNGLQVPGSEQIQTVVTGVSANVELFARARARRRPRARSPGERSMARAREGEVHFLDVGHYATETFGVRALGERLAERFGIRHVFVDVPNPI